MLTLAGFGHLLIGYVDVSLLLWLLSGSVPGVLLGVFLSSRLPQGALRMALSGTLFAIGAKPALA